MILLLANPPKCERFIRTDLRFRGSWMWLETTGDPVKDDYIVIQFEKFIARIAGDTL